MSVVPALEVERAYRECERITRTEAANFFYGIRLLPGPKRRAMSAVYAFARRVDDIGDGDLPAQEKLVGLESERALVAALGAGDAAGTGDPVVVALDHARKRFGLPLDAFEALIEGVELDVRETRYETFDELVVYCRDVAGSIGRLCLAIFGHEDRAPDADALADDLGVAMQLTNILRDVLEDHRRGRVYLPAEDLRAFGCAGPLDLSPELVRFEAARAAEWFDRGLTLADMLDPRSRSCLAAMTGIYRRILQRIERRPEEILEHRISLPPWEKAWLAARGIVGAAA
ncbi:MAG TPA: squalene/phytoene synthase family protein [Solirubrobacteraceae bacterium]|nr:squalene/phytoene synthase family protein [Solirubrobacteraceae bacterium]